MPRDCTTHGHIQVDTDPCAECLACGQPLTTHDRIAIHVTRPHDELDCPASTATIREWGHANTGTQPPAA